MSRSGVVPFAVELCEWQTPCFLMLTAYAKADRDDLTVADRKALARLVTEIEREGDGR